MAYYTQRKNHFYSPTKYKLIMNMTVFDIKYQKRIMLTRWCIETIK